MDKGIYESYIKNFDINLLNCTFLGKGHNGVVYKLPDGKVIKICFSIKSCSKEYYILNKIKKNKYFPRVYCMMGNYMIRDYVEGIPLNKYIINNGLSEELALQILDLLEEFKQLKFTKLDVRCKDIMVKPDGTPMIIDPKKFYTKDRNFPSHLAKGLKFLGVLDFFLEIAKTQRPKLYKAWGINSNDFTKSEN